MIGLVGTPEISKTPVHRDEVLRENEVFADTDTERIEGCTCLLA